MNSSPGDRRNKRGGRGPRGGGGGGGGGRHAPSRVAVQDASASNVIRKRPVDGNEPVAQQGAAKRPNVVASDIRVEQVRVLVVYVLVLGLTHPPSRPSTFW